VIALCLFLCLASAPRAAHGDAADDIAAVTAALPTCDAARAHCIGIQLHVAVGPDDGDGLIAPPAWFALQLATANRHFGALDVGFQVVGIEALPASCAHIATREERDAVAEGRLGGKVIHVFITGQLDDIDEPGRFAYGVTWHTRDGRKYVIVSTRGRDRTLAHELGHVFGLPHSRYAISIMNKTERTRPPPAERTFADPEIAAMRPVLRRLLRDRVIADVPR
jgi:hypothetical protein